MYHEFIHDAKYASLNVDTCQVSFGIKEKIKSDVKQQTGGG